MCEGLYAINFSDKDLANSYAKAHNMDRDLVSLQGDKMEKMGSSPKAINENTHEATVQDSHINGKLAEQMDDLVNRTQT